MPTLCTFVPGGGIFFASFVMIRTMLLWVMIGRAMFK